MKVFVKSVFCNQYNGRRTTAATVIVEGMEISINEIPPEAFEGAFKIAEGIALAKMEAAMRERNKPLQVEHKLDYVIYDAD